MLKAKPCSLTCGLFTQVQTVHVDIFHIYVKGAHYRNVNKCLYRRNNCGLELGLDELNSYLHMGGQGCSTRL